MFSVSLLLYCIHNLLRHCLDFRFGVGEVSSSIAGDFKGVWKAEAAVLSGSSAQSRTAKTVAGGDCS